MQNQRVTFRHPACLGWVRPRVRISASRPNRKGFPRENVESLFCCINVGGSRCILGVSLESQSCRVFGGALLLFEFAFAAPPLVEVVERWLAAGAFVAVASTKLPARVNTHIVPYSGCGPQQTPATL